MTNQLHYSNTSLEYYQECLHILKKFKKEFENASQRSDLKCLIMKEAAVVLEAIKDTAKAAVLLFKVVAKQRSSSVELEKSLARILAQQSTRESDLYFGILVPLMKVSVCAKNNIIRFP